MSDFADLARACARRLDQEMQRLMDWSAEMQAQVDAHLALCRTSFLHWAAAAGAPTEVADFCSTEIVYGCDGDVGLSPLGRLLLEGMGLSPGWTTRNDALRRDAAVLARTAERIDRIHLALSRIGEMLKGQAPEGGGE